MRDQDHRHCLGPIRLDYECLSHIHRDFPRSRESVQKAVVAGEQGSVHSAELANASPTLALLNLLEAWLLRVH